MKKVALLITVLILNCFALQAKQLNTASFDANYQLDEVNANIYEGYIITNNNDTLIGYIQMLSPIYNSIRVPFSFKKEEKPEIFKSEELLGYGYKVKDALTDSMVWMEYEKYYIHLPSIPFGSNEVLLYKSQSGRINLYYHFYESPLTPTAPIKLTFFIKMKDRMLEHLTEENYKAILEKLGGNTITKNDIETSEYSDVGYWISYLNDNKGMNAN